MCCFTLAEQQLMALMVWTRLFDRWSHRDHLHTYWWRLLYCLRHILYTYHLKQLLKKHTASSSMFASPSQSPFFLIALHVDACTQTHTSMRTPPHTYLFIIFMRTYTYSVDSPQDSWLQPDYFVFVCEPLSALHFSLCFSHMNTKWFRQNQKRPEESSPVRPSASLSHLPTAIPLTLDWATLSC